MFICRLQVCLCICLNTLHWGCQKLKRASGKLKPVQHGSSKLTSNMRRSPERGHHLKQESVWRTRGTMWGGGGAGWTGGYAEPRRHTLLWLSPLSSWLSVTAENSESAASVRARWRKSLKRLTLLYPVTSLQGSCCHGHCEWKSKKRNGVALQFLHTELSVSVFFFNVVYLNICCSYNLFILYILLC